MRKSQEEVSWVVYKMPDTAKGEGRNVVCEQSEWDKIERATPGVNILIQEGITNEGEAERLARGTSGDRRNSGALKKKG